jgi:tetratricopeptide (TPR) repeat protein
LYKLSKALHKLNDIDGEKSVLERTIQVNPNLAEAQNELGYLAAHGGDPAQAELYFRAAVRASSSYVAAWVNLAATQASEEKWTEAHEALDHALEIDPDNAEARQLAQAIRDAHPGP